MVVSVIKATESTMFFLINSINFRIRVFNFKFLQICHETINLRIYCFQENNGARIGNNNSFCKVLFNYEVHVHV